MQQERIRAVRRAVAGCILVAGLFLMGCAPSQEVTHYIMGLIQRVDTLYLGTDWKAHHVNILYDRRQTVCKTYETAACAAQCEQYGDTHYRERLYDWQVLDRKEAWVFCADRIDSVQVRAAIAVDAGHPAGASLNDIFYFFSVTPDNYLRNGYKRDEDEYRRVMSTIPGYIRNRWIEADVDWMTLHHTLMPIFGRLDKLDFSQYSLLGWHDKLMELYPLVELPKQYLGLKVTVYFSSGRIIESVEIEW